MKLPFDAEAAERILKVIYCLCTYNRFRKFGYMLFVCTANNFYPAIRYESRNLESRVEFYLPARDFGWPGAGPAQLSLIERRAN